MVAPELPELGNGSLEKGRWASDHRVVNFWEGVFALTTAILATIPILVFLAIIVFMVYDSVEFFRSYLEEGKAAGATIWQFFTDREWTVMFEPPEGERRRIGVMSLIIASSIVALIAVAVAAPLGVLMSVVVTHYLPKRLNYFITPVLNMISGVPTIVLGAFAFSSFTPALQKIFPQIQPYNLLVSGLLVGLFVTPTVLGIGVSAINAVPRSYFEAAYSLGMRKYEYILNIVLPTVFPALIAAFTLAFSRAFGETMIPVLASGLTPQFTFNPLQAGQTVASFIFQAATAAVGFDTLEFKSMFATGLVLFLLTFALNSVGNLSRRRFAAQIESLGVSKVEEGTGSLPGEETFYALGERMTGIEFKRNDSLRALGGAIFAGLSYASLVPTFLLLLFLTVSNFRQGARYLNGKFFTQFADPDPEQAGILAALVGNLWLVLLVLVILIVVGLGAAIFLEEYAEIFLFKVFRNRKVVQWVETLLEINLDNLSAIPTIIYGVLGTELFIRTMKMGRSVLAGTLTLAILALPFVITTFRASLRNVPATLRYAGYAVGMSKSQVILRIAIPYAFSGLTSGVLLAATVTMGETAALGAVVGSLGLISFTPFNNPEGRGPFLSQFVTIPLQIYIWATKPTTEPLAAAAIVVLLTILLILGALALFTANLFQSKTYES
ncbi:MAG: ABC transporter permease subunit [Pseudanabaenaceae cyanobacterium]